MPDPREEERKKESEARLPAQRAETKRKLKEEFPLFAAVIDRQEQ